MDLKNKKKLKHKAFPNKDNEAKEGMKSESNRIVNHQYNKAIQTVDIEGIDWEEKEQKARGNEKAKAIGKSI